MNSFDRARALIQAHSPQAKALRDAETRKKLYEAIVSAKGDSLANEVVIGNKAQIKPDERRFVPEKYRPMEWIVEEKNAETIGQIPAKIQEYEAMDAPTINRDVQQTQQLIPAKVAETKATTTAREETQAQINAPKLYRSNTVRTLASAHRDLKNNEPDYAQAENIIAQLESGVPLEDLRKATTAKVEKDAQGKETTVDVPLYPILDNPNAYMLAQQYVERVKPSLGLKPIPSHTATGKKPLPVKGYYNAGR